ncbi:hypothetical protein MKK49_07045 [Methylobacterium sp. J-090]|nr:hypothetical protein [Methylobacterium sp. J-090]
MIEFFDREGRETAFCRDGHSVYLWNGTPAAFIDDDQVFAYSGRFIGLAKDGWIWDENGERLLFEFDAVGGPAKPKRQTKTAAGPRLANPARGTPHRMPTRPAPSAAWSDRSFADLI